MKIATTFLVAALAMTASSANGALIISEIVDGTLTGGVPKFVELTNTGDAPLDMSGYSIGNYNNGGTTLGGSSSTLLSGILAPGDSYVVSYENSDGPGVGVFFDTYGFDPDHFSLGALINGDDVLAIFLADGSGPGGAATGDGSDATLVDIYGVVGVDGTGEVWEYLDGYSFRNPEVFMPMTPFAPMEWTYGGPDSLEGADAAGSLALLLSLTTPGTHVFVPEPATLVLLALGGVTLLRRR